MTARQIGQRLGARTELERFGGCGAATYSGGGALAASISVLAESRGADGRVDVIRVGDYGRPPEGADLLPRTAQGTGIGSTLDELRKAHPTLTEAPNYYDPDSTEATLAGPDGLAMVFHVFSDGRVTGVSTGRTQQLRYVEGCS